MNNKTVVTEETIEMALPKLYNIYVLQNDEGNIKIGITQNFEQRLTSLSGSNSAGHKIDKYFVSEPTYLESLERVMHGIYATNRIDGTEWFRNLEFDDVVKSLKDLMSSDSYKKCMQVREQYHKQLTFSKRRVSVYR